MKPKHLTASVLNLASRQLDVMLEMDIALIRACGGYSNAWHRRYRGTSIRALAKALDREHAIYARCFEALGHVFSISQVESLLKPENDNYRRQVDLAKARL
jgi:hypothetical protein